jgi:ribosome-associated protein
VLPDQLQPYPAGLVLVSFAIVQHGFAQEISEAMFVLFVNSRKAFVSHNSQSPIPERFSYFCPMHLKPPYLLSEFVFKTSRSGGKGGQNVNKVSTKVLIEFSIPDSYLLSEEEKTILLEKLSDRLTKDGVLQIVAQEERSQLANKEIALKKLYATLNKCFIVKKKRKATKASKSSVEKRLQSKKRTSEIKKMRKVDRQ